MFSLGLIDFLQKNGAFDFGSAISYANNTLYSCYCSHKYQLDEISWADIYKLDITGEGAAIVIT